MNYISFRFFKTVYNFFMKKILILIILLLILIFNCAKTQNDFTLKDYFPTGEITYYTNENVDTTAHLLPNVYISKSSNYAIGESIFLKNIEIGNAIKTLGARVLLVETLQEKNLTILYCNLPQLHISVDYKGFDINLQIASCEDYTVIGWPMILGSF